MEQDITVHVNIYFYVWNVHYIFQYRKHLKSVGKLARYLYIVPSACWRHVHKLFSFSFEDAQEFGGCSKPSLDV